MSLVCNVMHLGVISLRRDVTDVAALGLGNGRALMKGCDGESHGQHADFRVPDHDNRKGPDWAIHIWTAAQAAGVRLTDMEGVDHTHLLIWLGNSIPTLPFLPASNSIGLFPFWLPKSSHFQVGLETQLVQLCLFALLAHNPGLEQSHVQAKWICGFLGSKLLVHQPN